MNDENEALRHLAPEHQANDSQDILEGVEVRFDERKFTKAQIEQMKTSMRFIAQGVISQKEDE